MALKKSNEWFELVTFSDRGRASRTPLRIRNRSIVPKSIKQINFHDCEHCGGVDTNLILSYEDGGAIGGTWECYSCGA